MSRVRATAVAALLSITSLTSCSSGGSDDGKSVSSGDPGDSKPITKELTQGEITQALLGTGETLPGWTPHDNKSVTEGQYCTKSEDQASPAGWLRGSDASYEYNGSTLNMSFVHICLFDTTENAKSAYAAWKGTEQSKEQTPKMPVGEETTLVINPGASDDSINAFSRSGKVNIRVKIEGTGEDTSGARAMLAATLKRLQQVQDGKPATAKAIDEQTKVQK